MAAKKNEKIEFLQDYLGHDAGSSKVVSHDLAHDLLKKGIVKIVPMPVVHVTKVAEEPVERPSRRLSRAK